MTSEQKYFIQILSDHLVGRESCPPEKPVDWEDIVSAAKKHDLAAIVWHQCHKFSPQAEDLYGHCRNSLYNYGRRLKTEELIKTAFEKAGIENFVVKGSLVATLYPIPAYRTMGDTDFVVRKSEYERAHDCLLDEGFKCKNPLSDERVYYRDGIFIELHFRLIDIEDSDSQKSFDYFNNCWDHASNGWVDPDFHMEYLIDHVRKHLVYEGVGFRQFMDVAVLTKNCGELNWSRIEKRMRENGIWGFAERTLAMNEKWFGVKSPVTCGVVSDDFYDAATENIYTSGAFGRDNSANEVGEAVKSSRDSKHKRLRMISNSLRFIFPSYEKMRQNPPFAFVDRRPYLLPVAWVYRIVRSIFVKHAGKGIRAAKSYIISDEEYAKREEWLKSWRL